MTKFITFLGLSMFFVANFINVPHVFGASAVYISEVNYNGSSVNGGDKWVELTNPTNRAINLAGWKLNMPNSSKTGVVALDGTIFANSPFIIGVKNAKFTNVYSQADISNYNITNISNTQPGEINYISLQLIDDTGSIISQINKDNNFVKSLGVSNKGGIKHSLECDSQGICSLSTNLYGGTNLDYGTPGVKIVSATQPEQVISDPVQIHFPSSTPFVVEPIVNSQPVYDSSVNTVNALEITKNVSSEIYQPLSISEVSVLNNSTTNDIAVSKIQPIITSAILPLSSFESIKNTALVDMQIPKIIFESIESKALPLQFKSPIASDIQSLFLSVLIMNGLAIQTKSRIPKLSIA
jgi:hypothetical protein